MARRTLPAAPAAALVLLALAVALASCQETEEDTSQLATEGPTARATASAWPTVSATATPDVTTSPVAASPSPTFVPETWATYDDPTRGLSLRYPPELVFKDLTGSAAPGGSYDAVLDFRSATDPTRGFSVEILHNPLGVTPMDWARNETACLPDTILEANVVGQPAVFCTEQATEIPNALVVFAHMEKMYEVGSLLSPTEFESVLSSIRL